MSELNVHIEIPVRLDDEENRAQTDDGERLTDVEVAAGVMAEIPAAIRENISNICTGMNSYFTYGLLDLAEAGSDLVPEQDEDSDVQGVTPFYTNWKQFLDDDGVESNREARFAAWEWARKQLYVEPFDDYYESTVDLVIVANFGADRGETIIKHAQSEGIPTMEVKVTDLADKEKVFGEEPSEEDVEPDGAEDMEEEREAPDEDEVPADAEAVKENLPVAGD
ncbi:hypothetical protein [Salinibaculum rarum]|uniref:hypothetical protein n=1 Tax=Salinibaculum rarum TaxID=3058903 RepID=UPI00265FC71E|nr:hypothetical protein [Salinibaculum sp. KK48]